MVKDGSVSNCTHCYMYFVCLATEDASFDGLYFFDVTRLCSGPNAECADAKSGIEACL